jgi:hypothetical protein
MIPSPDCPAVNIEKKHQNDTLLVVASDFELQRQELPRRGKSAANCLRQY